MGRGRARAVNVNIQSDESIALERASAQRDERKHYTYIDGLNFILITNLIRNKPRVADEDHEGMYYLLLFLPLL